MASVLPYEDAPNAPSRVLSAMLDVEPERFGRNPGDLAGVLWRATNKFPHNEQACLISCTARPRSLTRMTPDSRDRKEEVSRAVKRHQQGWPCCGRCRSAFGFTYTHDATGNGGDPRASRRRAVAFRGESSGAADDRGGRRGLRRVQSASTGRSGRSSWCACAARLTPREPEPEVIAETSRCDRGSPPRAKRCSSCPPPLTARSEAGRGLPPCSRG